MKNNKFVSLVIGSGIALSLLVALPVFAATGAQWGGAQGWGGSGSMHRPGGVPGVFGTVTAISGTTLTVSAQMRMRPMSPSNAMPAVGSTTVYTVDASNATVYKGGATTTIPFASIATGDTVMVQGTVSGTNITATIIRDGVGGTMMGGRGFGGRNASSTPHTMPTPVIQGNGEPVIGGAVTAINGSSLTVTNASNVTYTVDVTNATLIKNGTSTTLTNIAVGDTLVVQGTVNGTSVTASSVIDQGAKSSTSASAGGASAPGPRGGFGGIFSAIGGFFQRLFGF
jgi:hypothetical protein